MAEIQTAPGGTADNVCGVCHQFVPRQLTAKSHRFALLRKQGLLMNCPLRAGDHHRSSTQGRFREAYLQG